MDDMLHLSDVFCRASQHLRDLRVAMEDWKEAHPEWTDTEPEYQTLRAQLDEALALQKRTRIEFHAAQATIVDAERKRMREQEEEREMERDLQQKLCKQARLGEAPPSVEIRKLCELIPGVPEGRPQLSEMARVLQRALPFRVDGGTFLTTEANAVFARDAPFYECPEMEKALDGIDHACAHVLNVDAALTSMEPVCQAWCTAVVEMTMMQFRSQDYECELEWQDTGVLTESATCTVRTNGVTWLHGFITNDDADGDMNQLVDALKAAMSQTQSQQQGQHVPFVFGFVAQDDQILVLAMDESLRTQEVLSPRSVIDRQDRANVVKVFCNLGCVVPRMWQ